MTEVSLKLTKRSAESLPPKSAKYVAWDSEVSGFGIRIMPSGSKSYILKYRIGRGRSAKTRTITLGKLEDSTPEASRRLARDCKAEARLGQDPFKTEEHLVDDGTQTFAELFETWQEKAAHISRRTGALRKAANVKLDVDRLKIHVLPLLGDKPINQIKLADIANVRDQITSGATRTQKKNEATWRSARQRRCRNGQKDNRYFVERVRLRRRTRNFRSQSLQRCTTCSEQK